MKKSLTDQLIEFFEDVCHNWDTRFGFVVCTKCGIVKNDKNYADNCKGSIKVKTRE